MKDYEEKVINIMDSIKFSMMAQINKAYTNGYDQGYADAKNKLGQNAIDLAHEENDRAYQQGYEDKQKQDTIQVGDEVVMDDKGRKAVVSRVLDDAYNIVFYNGDTNCVDRCFIAKTGRHFSQIAEVLAEMRGEE